DIVVYFGDAFDSFNGFRRVILGHRLRDLARQRDFRSLDAVLQVVEDTEPRYLDQFVAYFTRQPLFIVLTAARGGNGSLSALIPGKGTCGGDNAKSSNYQNGSDPEGPNCYGHIILPSF